MKKGRPIPAAKIKAAVKLIERIGLCVYGPCIDLKSGERFGANMDFSAQFAARYYDLKRHGKLWQREEI